VFLPLNAKPHQENCHVRINTCINVYLSKNISLIRIFIFQHSLYNFEYEVKDESLNNHFGHTEASDGRSVSGVYHVAVDDSHIQRVDYNVGGSFSSVGNFIQTVSNLNFCIVLTFYSVH